MSRAEPTGYAPGGDAADRRAGGHTAGYADGHTVEGAGAPLTVACLAAVLVAALAFVPIVQGLDWWAAAIVFSCAAVTAASLARWIGMPPLASALVGATSILLVGNLLYGQGFGLLGFLPTPESAQAVMRTTLAAEQQILTDSVPAAGTEGPALVLGAGIEIVLLRRLRGAQCRASRGACRRAARSRRSGRASPAPRTAPSRG